MDKKTSFQYKVFTIMLLAIILVGFTGFYAYQQFSQIVANISEEAKTDMRLVTAKSLMNDVFEAENSVKSYSLTKDTTYLAQFYTAAEKTDLKLEKLRKSKSENHNVQIDIDSLDALINEKFNILNSLLIIQDKFRVEEALNKVVKKIDNNIKEADITKKDSITDNKATRKGLIHWLFSKNKKPKKVEDTSKIREITANEIKKEVESIKKEEENIEDELKLKELAYYIADKEVTLKIKGLIDELEKNELKSIEKQTKYAEIAMEKTNKQIAIFCLVVALLLLLVIYIIINYVRNNARYRKALKQAKAKAEDLAITKEKFLANMSHEIRTPMNAIAGFTEQIAKGPLTKEQDEQLMMVTKSVEHLLYLINDVLDFTKLQTGKLNLEVIGFKPNEVVKDVVTFITPLAKEKEISVKCEVNLDKDFILLGDPYRLRQILLNLISNSIKFTEKGSITVRMSTIMKNTDNTRIRMEVIDTGIGMTESQIVKVFNEFEQAEVSTARNYGGTGLGLSIVNMLVKLHDGKVELFSTYEKGTTVIVEIPYLIGTNDDIKLFEKQKSFEQLSIPQNLKILIVDDEEYNRKLLITILKKHHVYYTEARTGVEAIKEVNQNNYDLVLMDARMPELDGLSATKKIRKLTDKNKNSVPIIALTAAVTEEDRNSYNKAGMNGFLAKPFRENELLKTINNVLNPANAKLQYSSKNKVEGVIDFTDLKKLSDGDRNFYKEMLTTFLNSTQDGIKDMEIALEENDWGMMAEYAHRICAPCKHLSAEELYRLLKDIELNCRDENNVSSVNENFNAVKKQFKRIKKLVEEELKN